MAICSNIAPYTKQHSIMYECGSIQITKQHAALASFVAGLPAQESLEVPKTQKPKPRP